MKYYRKKTKSLIKLKNLKQTSNRLTKINKRIMKIKLLN